MDHVSVIAMVHDRSDGRRIFSAELPLMGRKRPLQPIWSRMAANGGFQTGGFQEATAQSAVEITVIAQQLSEQIGDLAVAALPERISTFGLGTSVRPHLNEQTSRR